MEHRNKNLDHSLAVLSHPLTVLVFLLYLANTFLFQRIFPSWWAGKIGDFAWLFFFPFVVCVPLSLLVARRNSNKQVIYLAIALCGIPFALLKSSNYLLGIVSGTFRTWMGMSLDLAGDPSDLIALTSLVGAAWFWKQPRPLKAIPRRFAYILAAASVIFTLADSAGPDMGIHRLVLQDEHLYACSSYVVFHSEDGGMEWEQIQETPQIRCGVEDGKGTVVDPSNPNIQYKYESPWEIHRSEDGGSTWRLDYSWKPASEAAQLYLDMRQPTEYYVSNPLNAVYETRSGDTFFAMGFEGILIRRQSGEYVWKPVGSFQRIEVEPRLVLESFIWGRIYLAFLLGCLLVTLLVLKVAHPQFGVFFIYFLLFAWLLESSTLPPTAFSLYSYDDSLHTLGCQAISVLVFPFFIIALIVAGKYGRRLFLWSLLFLVLVVLTFPLPYALWALGVYNGSYYNFWFAILLESGIAVLFIRAMLRKFSVVPNPVQSQAKDQGSGAAS